MKKTPVLFFSLAIVFIDQITKYAIVRGSVSSRPIVLIPGVFALVFTENTGALFGLFRDVTGPLRTLLLLVVPCAAIVLVLFFLRLTPVKDHLSRTGLSLILGGAVGNQVDRLFRSGRVVDFLDVSLDFEPFASALTRVFGTSHWPAFNVADSAIVTGALLLGAALLLQARADRKSRPASAG